MARTSTLPIFIRSLKFRVSCLSLTLLIAACTSTPSHRLPAIPELVNQPQYPIPDVNLLALSPGMKAFAERYANNDNRRQGKAWALAYATMGPDVLEFKYDPRLTLPADKVFEKKAGNCLSFSSMFVAMARYVGLTAYFQEVEIPPTWSNVDDNMLVGRHVNAVVLDRANKITVDASGRIGRENDRTRRLSDTEAQAEYYNNLGVDALIDKNIPLAYAYIHKGLERVPQLAHLWANLGLILRRNGQTEDAITAYKTALQLNPEQSVALNNLHILYTEDGNLKAAEELSRRVEKVQRKNPYYIQHLAETAIEEQRYADAITLATKAIKMDSEEYRFYYTLARSQYLAGKTDMALANLDQARKRAPDIASRRMLVLPDDDL